MTGFYDFRREISASSFRGVIHHEDFDSFRIEGEKFEASIVLMMSDQGDIMSWKCATSGPPPKRTEIYSSDFTRVKGFVVGFEVSVQNLALLPNSTVSSWEDLEDLVAAEVASVYKEDDANKEDAKEEFLTKLRATPGVSLRFTISAAPQGLGLNLDLVSIQVYFIC